MIFQTLDDKDECVAIYRDGKIISKDLPTDLTHTWGWAPYLPDGVDYARIWVNGATLDEVCPEHLKEEWDEVNQRLRAFYRSFITAKIDLTKHCFFDMVQEGFLVRFCEVKNKICKWIFETYERPANHDKIIETLKALNKMKDYPVNLDLEAIKKERFNKKVLAFSKKIENWSCKIDYDAFGTATGRLSTTKSSFPIMRLDKELRKFIKPNNDWFVELDINAADIRSLFFILGKDQPPIDIHDWNIQNVFGKDVDRDLAKKMIFSWLYDLNKTNDKLEVVYGRDKIIKEFWIDNHITNPFGRKIKVSKDNAISYLVQSTTADYVLGKLVKIVNLLEGLKTKIAFTIHDSIVLDLAWEERNIIAKVLAIMREDGFVVSCKTGKDFGDLKELKL